MPRLSFTRSRVCRPRAALVGDETPPLQLSSHLTFRPYRELFGDPPNWRTPDRIRHRRYSGRVQLVDPNDVEVLLSEWPSGRTLRIALPVDTLRDMAPYAGQPVLLDTWIEVDGAGDTVDRWKLVEHQREADSP